MSTAHTGTDAAEPRPADLPAAVARSASRYRALAIVAQVLASVRTMFRMMTHETSDPGEITEAFDVMGVTGPDPVATLLAQLPRPATPDRICTELIERTRPALSSGDWHDDRTVVSFAWGG